MNPWTILVIEDDNDIRSALQILMELEGYSVQTAMNGQEGLNILRGINGSCLVLLDWMMPVMDGKGFLAAKLTEPAIASVPVLLVSAVADEVGKGLKGVVGAISKPIQIDSLLKAVQRICV